MIVIINGIRRVNSTSKIKKIIAIKKKCNENGSRAEFLGSNPHSNGLFFSRSIKVFFEIIEDNLIMIPDKMNKHKIIFINKMIIYTK